MVNAVEIDVQTTNNILTEFTPNMCTINDFKMFKSTPMLKKPYVSFIILQINGFKGLDTCSENKLIDSSIVKIYS